MPPVRRRPASRRPSLRPRPGTPLPDFGRPPTGPAGPAAARTCREADGR